MITKQELEEQLARKSPEWWDSVQKMVGRENLYYCPTCKGSVCTVDRDAGVTPMFLSCRTETCSGIMRSSMYPPPETKPAWVGEATEEWYRPNEIDDDAEDATADHLMGGGLLLREVTSD